MVVTVWATAMAWAMVTVWAMVMVWVWATVWAWAMAITIKPSTRINNSIKNVNLQIKI